MKGLSKDMDSIRAWEATEDGSIMVPRDGVVNLDKTQANAWVGLPSTDPGAQNEATGVKNNTQALDNVLTDIAPRQGVNYHVVQWKGQLTGQSTQRLLLM
eukprot:4953342-Karenia_brevis.AAC.1